MDDPSQANPREYLRQAIDAEIKSLDSEESIRALRYRRNTLAPVSSLPTELITAVFSFLPLPGSSPPGRKSERLALPGTLPLGGKSEHHLAWLHVCHQWREIALNQPLLWSYVNFDDVTLAGAAEMLTRAKKSPLRLEATFRGCNGDEARFSAFKKELQPRVSHIRHLTINTVYPRRTFEGLASPAPTLEYLSLSVPWIRASVPDTLFDGTTPRLSCLKLYSCDVSWKSPLLKGLRNLEIRKPSVSARPILADWLDALDEMPQLKRLALHWASPIAPPFPFGVGRTVTLPFLTHLDISACVGDCALALAHLVLPVLTRLCLKPMSAHPDGGDVLNFLPYVARHAHGPQDTQLLQSVFISGKRGSTDIFTWPVADIIVEEPVRVASTFGLRALTLTTRMALSLTIRDWSISNSYINAAMATLPLDSLVTFIADHYTQLDEHFWLSHAPQWSLLQHVRLAAPAARGFIEMLLQDNDGRECPLLPSLIKLDLIHDNVLGARGTLRLCDALMKRVEQGVPLETLDLCTCCATSHTVRLLSEIVVDVLGPDAQHLVTRRHSIPDDNSRAEDYPDDDDDANDDDEEGDNDNDEIDEEEGEEEGNYSEMDEY